ncbi:membrane protein insertase YidC [Oleidesulfovibrio sp.]|uniref:membrane protein insertase YidC n=1 Tax=Oleidesulfovibrio sp. TaxID=2909707 RepID=UPI003A8AC023
MENKRPIIAVVLSLFVLIGWSYLSEFMGWAPAPAPKETAAVEQTADVQKNVPAAEQVVAPATVSSFVPTEGREVTVDTPLYSAVFHSQGGVLKHFKLKKYKDTIEEDSPLVELISDKAAGKAPMGILMNGQPTWKLASWQFDGSDLKLDGSDKGQLVFVGELEGVRFERTLTFDPASYLISENVRMMDTTGVSRDFRLGVTMSTGSLSPEGGAYNLTRLAWYQDGFDEETSADDLTEKGVQVENNISWGGVMCNYFMAVMAPADTASLFKGLLEDGVYRSVVEKNGVAVAAHGTTDFAIDYYIGPKESDRLAAMPDKLSETLNYGWFTFLAKPLVSGLKFFYSYVGNYGVAIIFLTILVKLLFWPLSQKSYKSMEQMKRLQPMVQKIKEKYGDDRQRMNQEVMELYKTYKVNPAGGCLPMLLQIPVFLGLYQGLLNAIELRHAPFIAHLPFTDIVWLADLSAADPFWITPIVMGATMLLQQRLTPAPADPTQAKIMMFMPVIFTVMFLNFPAGLVVYWLVNNVLSIGQQWLMLRKS